MSLMVKAKSAYKVAKKFSVKHSPEILIGVAVVGVGVSIFTAVTAKPKIDQVVDDYKNGHISKGDCAWRIFRYAAPVALAVTVTIASMIGSNRISEKRLRDLGVAYAVAQSTAKEWQEKAKEVLTPKQLDKVHDKICSDRLHEHVEKNGDKAVYSTGRGEVLCYDVLSDRLFKSDINKIREACTNLSFRIMDEMYIDLNEFYCEIGLPRIPLGDQAGWYDNMTKIEPWFSSELINDQPVLAVDFRERPTFKDAKNYLYGL